MLAKATNPKLGFVSVQSSGTNHEAARTRVQGREGAVRPELLPAAGGGQEEEHRRRLDQHGRAFQRKSQEKHLCRFRQRNKVQSFLR